MRDGNDNFRKYTFRIPHFKYLQVVVFVARLTNFKFSGYIV